MARQEPRHDPEVLEELPNLAEKVFQIDLLREMILKKAVIDDDKEICWSSVCSLRLVQKSWLETVTKLLQKVKEPLFNFLLYQDNSLLEQVGEEEEKLLNRFVKAVTSGSMLTWPSVPAFTLTIAAHVFLQENRQSFSNMLVHCGAGLVELELDLPENGGTLHLMFPGFSLPNLRKLTINRAGFHRTDNISHFINNLLNAAPGLTHFLVPCSEYDDREFESLDFQCFTLPPTITTLELDCCLTSTNLEMLLNNSLPQLTSLKLLIPSDAIFPDGLLFRILDKLRKTLRNLAMTDRGYFGQIDVITRLGFPVMEELEEFSNSSLNCQLDVELRSLETLLPKLSRLTLTNQTIGMFRRWTDNRFPTVLHLEVHLVNENVDEFDNEYRLGLNLEQMERLHRAFPNVRKLGMTIRSTETCGLEYLFREMKPLTELKIDVVGRSPDRDSWDAVLIGASRNFVAGLRESPRLRKDFQLTNHGIPSIKNLQELTSLSLEAWGGWNDGGPDSLISDLAFRFALLKMPTLKELTLSGRFKVSDKMAKIWRRQGRKLV